MTPDESLSSQTIFVRSQPVGTASVLWYVPGATSALDEPPSLNVPATSPVKVKVAGSPAGSVSFLIVIEPRWVFV
jgi:hypothetical protein